MVLRAYPKPPIVMIYLLLKILLSNSFIKNKNYKKKKNEKHVYFSNI